VTHLKERRAKEERLLELKGLNLGTIFEFNKKNPFLAKERCRAVIDDIFSQVIELNINFSQKEMELFGEAHKMVELNQRGSVVITTLLLMILRRMKRESSTIRKR